MFFKPPILVITSATLLTSMSSHFDIRHVLQFDDGSLGSRVQDAVQASSFNSDGVELLGTKLLLSPQALARHRHTILRLRKNKKALQKKKKRKKKRKKERSKQKRNKNNKQTNKQTNNRETNNNNKINLRYRH